MGYHRLYVQGWLDGPQCVIVYMGHVIPYDATSASSDRMAGTGGIYRMGPRVRYIVVGECKISETGHDRSIVNRNIICL